MTRAHPSFGRRNWIRPTLLLLMICHLGRFYADAPVALAICFEHNHQPAATHELNSDGHLHHEHAAVSAAPVSEPDSGFKIEHCKDTYQGMNLIPLAVLSLPNAAPEVALTEDITRRDVPDGRRIQQPDLSIFHPPQLLS